ncbi:MAG: ATP-binding cassette domain-containing protein, partial [Atribacterota bacterium]
APFFKKYSSGELAMRAMGVSQIRDILSGTMATTIISGIFSIFNLGLMFYYNVQLAGIALLLVILATAVTIFLGFRHIVFERKVVDYSNRITGLVFQLISGIAKFRVAGAEKRAFFQWSREFSEQRKIAYQGATYSNWMSTFNSFFPVMASIAIFFVVVRSGNLFLSAGAFIAFQAAFLTLTDAVSSLSEAVLSMNVVIPLYERSKPIFETLPEYDEIKEEPGELTGAIEVSHVSFRYEDGGPLVLKDVSLQVKEGEYLGLVGPSGSGKSTLFRILLSFEKPERGKVYYNGQDLESLDIRAVRRQLGVVIQNGQLLAGDILSNIIGANPNLTLDDALEAAKLVGLYQDIEEMPMGMFTLVSEGGSTLSGGQRQRILIARAIVNKPKILFFDEATSSLDNRTQAIVSESLGRLKATRVVIAHRLSTIQRCDRILVLDQGRIVEVGTYDELMRKNGLFADLAKRQLA